MKNRATLALPMLLAACAAGDAAAPAVTPLRAGVWIHHGPRHILGSGTDTVFELRETADGFELRRTIIRHPNIRNRGDISVWRHEPQPVTVDGAWLCIGDEERATFRFDGDDLVFPGIVELSPGRWVYGEVQPGSSHRVEQRFECEHDPREVPNGSASFRTATPAELRDTCPQSYAATIGPSGELARVEFHERFADGEVRRFALIQDERYGLCFDGSGWFDVRQRWLLAADPERDRFALGVSGLRPPR